MEKFNSSSVVNITAGGGGGDNLLQDESPEYGLEAYTVVLSAAAHVVSMIFGGGSSLAIIVAIVTRGNINRYSYTLVITFFITCCSLNFVWSPLEITDLIMFHYMHRHPCPRFVAVRTALYLFIILLISIIIVLLSVEGIIRLKNYFSRLLKRVWPVTSSVLAVMFLAVFFIIKEFHTRDGSNRHYIIMDKNERFLILVLTVFAYFVVGLMLLILSVLMIKETVSWEDGRIRVKRKMMKLEIPEFLISQSNACANSDDGYGNSQSETPSPTTPKFVIDREVDTSSIKGEDCSHISELPKNMAKSTGNRLGINMAQVLGRRRHTICQITDSASSIITPADHLARAKQYNYVRKFSVDISALQAQLQNPKIFREAPYSSDIDLSRSPTSETAAAIQVAKPLLQLKPLSGNLDCDQSLHIKKTDAKSGSVGANINSPPVIMVSNDDALVRSGSQTLPFVGSEIMLNSRDVGVRNDGIVAKEECYVGDSGNEATIQKPIMSDFNESTEEHTSAPTLGSVCSDAGESDGIKLVRLTILVSLTFVLNMLPVLVTELMQGRLSRHAFVNISTCTLAVSSIQTIVYPHLIASCDDVIHKAVDKLKRRARNLYNCRSTEVHIQTEDSSSTDQL